LGIVQTPLGLPRSRRRPVGCGSAGRVDPQGVASARSCDRGWRPRSLQPWPSGSRRRHMTHQETRGSWMLIRSRISSRPIPSSSRYASGSVSGTPEIGPIDRDAILDENGSVSEGGPRPRSGRSITRRFSTKMGQFRKAGHTRDRADRPRRDPRRKWSCL